jgi:GntR family transcriptional regulator
MTKPLWARTADLVLQLIAEQGLTAGDRLPSERDLCSALDVSRVTLRKALAHLVATGLVSAAHGRGWFLADRPATADWPNDLESFTATARRKQMRPGSKIVRQEVRPAALDDAERLAIPAGTKLFHLERIRLLNDVPVAVDRTRMALDLAPGLLEPDYTTASLFEELRRCGVILGRSEATLEARAAGLEVAELLGLEPGAPILFLDQTIYAADRRPALLSTVEYSGERYRLRTTFQPTSAAHSSATAITRSTTGSLTSV